MHCVCITLAGVRLRPLPYLCPCRGGYIFCEVGPILVAVASGIKDRRGLAVGGSRPRFLKGAVVSKTGHALQVSILSIFSEPAAPRRPRSHAMPVWLLLF